MLTHSSRHFTPYAILAALPLVIASPASAATVSYDDMCFRSAAIVRWTPKEGPIARFVADAFENHTQRGLWIGLGRVGTSFWSAEGGDANDACDDCRILRLVETRADGTRKLHKLFDDEDNARIGSNPDGRKALVLARLWKLAKDTWPADKLKQDYALNMGKPAAHDPEKKLPFAVKVVAKNVFDIRYDFTAKPLMCWCVYDWQGQSRR